MEHLEVDGAIIEYQVQGTGEPVLLIPLSLVADGLGRPLLAQPELASRYQLIHYHRRGYLGSTLGTEPLTGVRQAADAAALLRHLGVKAAHIAGHSFGGLIALQLALDAQELVHSLALLEPPLRMVPSGKAAFERINLPMINAYRAGDRRKAVKLFSDVVFGPDWQTFVEQAVPGGVEQAVRDVDTFIQEQAAFQEWQFGPKEAGAITQPVLSVLGAAVNNPFMREGRALLHSWFPQTEDCDVPTTHLLQMQDPKSVALGLAEFFARHPMPVASISTQGPVHRGH
jgi:pimeloyl-ACP methyl ester carboxylesterase